MTAPMTVPLLVISGSLGTGKTTVLYEATDLLSEAGIAHAAIDLDCLAVMHSNRDPHGQRLVDWLQAGSLRLFQGNVSSMTKV